MTDYSAWPPDSWAPQLGKLSLEARTFSKNLTDFTASVQHSIDTGTIRSSLDTISTFGNHLSAGAAAAASIVTRVDAFSPMAAMPDLLFKGAQRASYLPLGSAIGPISAVLASAASMATTVRSATDHLFTAVPGALTAINPINPAQFLQAWPATSRDFAVATGLVSLGNAFQNNVSAFGSLVDTSLATAQLSTQIFSRPGVGSASYLAQASESFSTLNVLASAIYQEYAALQSIDTRSFLFHAPTVEPYAAAQATGLLIGVDDAVLRALRVESTEVLLDELGDDFQSRLEAVSPELADVYREGLAAMESRHHGWIRHAGVSFRTMFVHLLRQLAPDATLHSYYSDDPTKEMIDGEFTRDAQLRYIYRDVAIGSYAKMAEQDIKLAEATFFPANEVVHRLESPLSEHQMRVLWRRIQGSASVVLEAAGY